MALCPLESEPGSQNVADPMDPDPKHCILRNKWKKLVSRTVLDLRCHTWRLWSPLKDEKSSLEDLRSDSSESVWLRSSGSESCLVSMTRLLLCSRSSVRFSMFPLFPWFSWFSGAPDSGDVREFEEDVESEGSVKPERKFFIIKYLFLYKRWFWVCNFVIYLFTQVHVKTIPLLWNVIYSPRN